jgi:hypothetical protein
MAVLHYFHQGLIKEERKEERKKQTRRYIKKCVSPVPEKKL